MLVPLHLQNVDLIGQSLHFHIQLIDDLILAQAALAALIVPTMVEDTTRGCACFDQVSFLGQLSPLNVTPEPGLDSPDALP